MSALDVEAIRARAAIAAGAAAVADMPRLPLEAIRATCDAVPALLDELAALRTELAEEKSAHEQTVENFGDWIEDHQARSFRITSPTHTTGWVWNCLACPANGSFAREAEAFGWAAAHEMRSHGGGRAEQ